jgi:O-antigen/teichoic acid export membrane protein
VGGTVVRNTLVQLLPPFVRAGLGLALAVILSRYLGVKGFGQYALVFAYVAVFWGIFSDWGVGTVCLREISRGASSRTELIGGAASLQALIATGAYLLMLLSLIVTRYPAPVTESIAIYGLIILLNPLDILALPFQADLKVGRLVAPAVTGSIVAFGLALIVVSLRGPLPALAAAAFAGLLVQYAWVTIISVRNLPGLRASRFKWNYYLAEGWPLGLATIAGTFFQQGPVVALSFLSLESVGLFNAASRIPQQLNLLPVIVRVSTFPILSEAWVTDRRRFMRLVNTVLGASLLISVPLALLGIGLAEPLVRAMFGPAFSGAALPFKILMASFAITFPSIVLGEAMIAAGFQRVNLLVNLAGMPVLVVLLFALLPLGGAVGAAAAVVAIIAFIAAATLITAPRLLEARISLVPLLFGTAAAALGAAILVLASGLGAIPAALLAAAAAALVIGTADRSTFRLLWSMQPFHGSARV